MTREEYLETVRHIQELFAVRRAELLTQLEALESEQEKDLLALNRVWKLQHKDEQPPWMGDALESSNASDSRNGMKPYSKAKRIRWIIDRLSGSIDSDKVIKRHGEVFPDEDQPDTSNVSKVFRKMEGEGALKRTKEAGFQQPALYEKVLRS